MSEVVYLRLSEEQSLVPETQPFLSSTVPSTRPLMTGPGPETLGTKVPSPVVSWPRFISSVRPYLKLCCGVEALGAPGS